MLPAIILAAGEGKRIFPYDLTRQKAALPVGGQPLVRITVSQLRQLGCEAVAVVVGHRKERVRHALLGLEGIVFVEQKAPGGTAPAALLGWEALGRPDSALVLCGDVLLPAEALRALAELQESSRPAATALAAPLGGRNPQDWLRADVGAGALRGVEGHSRGGSHRLCGAYALGPAAWPYVEANPGIMESVPVGGMPPLEAELAQSFQMMIDAGLEVAAPVHEGLFCDLDKPWHILEANRLWARYRCAQLTENVIPASCQVSDGAEIRGHVALGENCVIGHRVVIEGNLIAGAGTSITNGAIVGGDCVIGAGSKVRNYCQVGGATVTGKDCIIAHGAEFGGVLFDGVYLYHYCELAGVLGASVDIGAATVCGNLRFDDADTVHRVRGRREVPEGYANLAWIGDHSRTGVNAILMPGVKIGAYSCVGPGVIQYEDVPHKALVLAKQELVHKPWGPEKYGW